MPQRLSAAITLTVINALKPGDTVYDTKLKGFGARRQKDAVSYILRTRVAGKERWFTIGRHGQPWTPDTARKKALAILADPTITAKVVAPVASQTFADVAEAFFLDHGPNLKPRSLEEYQRLRRLYLLPAFATMPIRDILRSDVKAAHTRWKAQAPRAANFALAVLSKLMSWAEHEDQGFRPEGSNPCVKIQRAKEARRERFLTPDELARLGAALEKAGADNLVGPYPLAALRLLVLTGARLNEVLTLEWSFIDFGRKMIFLPDSKTGQKPISLNDDAIEVLTTLPRFANNPFVIAGKNTGSHLVNLQKPWRLVRSMAKLDAVRIHDLRHTFASIAVASGGSLPEIGRQLGHSQPQTTQRYAHLADDPVRKLTETTGRKLAEAMRGKPRA